MEDKLSTFTVGIEDTGVFKSILSCVTLFLEYKMGPGGIPKFSASPKRKNNNLFGVQTLLLESM